MKTEEKRINEREFEKQNVFGKGEYNSAYAKYFSGASYLNPLTEAGKTVFLANVTFEPSCRNNRHIEVPGKNCKTEWCEPVSDEEYEKL